MNPGLIVLFLVAVVIFIAFVKTITIVPQRSAFIVERLGKYYKTLDAGFHILIPFVDRVAYKLNLKEQAVDVAPQSCITQDNVAVEVDGILYMQVMEAQRAVYGIDNYHFASIQLAQTTLRSVMGKLELDKTFEERESINAAVVMAVDKAAEPWGLKVTRYEVKNIVPPQSIKDAMEKQMRAEREKRALIAESEGDRQARINRAEGERQELIAKSEGEKQKRINEAEGRATEILRIAESTAAGIRLIADSLQSPGGKEALNLRIAEGYLAEFGKLAKTNNTMIIPSNLSDVGGMVASLTQVLDQVKK
jgi:regulator of protease activity HflC (stomatin/prohibitin superfamily)